jgi:hypothetical protein
MAVDDKINNIRAYLDKADSKIDKKIFASILDILEDISDELDEVNESMHF